MKIEDLVRAAQQGDLDARNELGKWLFQVLSAYFMVHFTRADADDLRQRTSIIVLEKLHRFRSRGPSSFRWWTLKIASFEAKDKIREPHRSWARRLLLLSQPSPSPLTPTSMLVNLQRRKLFHESLPLLPAAEREALEHGFAEGNDHELAEREGVSVATIRTRRFRAKKRLEDLLLIALASPPTPSTL